jgi:hypothetical protein
MKACLNSFADWCWFALVTGFIVGVFVTVLVIVT